MRISFKKLFDYPNCSLYVIILAFLSTAGLILGILIGAGNDNYLSLMRTVPTTRVSIVGLTASVILPVIVSTAVFFLQNAACIYICVSLRSIHCGLLIAALSGVFGSAAWLIRAFLVSEWAFSVMLFWLVIHGPRSEKRIMRLQTTVFASVCVAAGLVDYFIASPFMAMLVDSIT